MARMTDLRGTVGSLPTEQRRVIEQLLWEDRRTGTEVAGAMGAIRSGAARMAKRSFEDKFVADGRECTLSKSKAAASKP